MSTAGRISKNKPRFQPKRPNAAGARTNREPSSTSSVAITPKHAPVALPQLEELDEPELQSASSAPARAQARDVDKRRLDSGAVNRSPGSAFGPSDPSLRFSQSSPSSSPDRSQPASSLGFTSRAPFSTQATSIGPSSQPPSSFPAATQSEPAQSVSLLSLPQIQNPDPASNLALPTPPTQFGKSQKGKERAEDVPRSSATRERERGGPGAPSVSRGGRKHTNQNRDDAIGDPSEEPGSRDGEPATRGAGNATRKGRVPKLATRFKRLAAGSDESAASQSSEDEWDTMKPRKRRAKKPPTKRGKVDAMLFGPDEEDDDSSEAVRQGEASHSDGGSDSEDAGDRGNGARRAASARKTSKPKKRPLEAVLLPVDPSQTTMSQLAEANPAFELGRPSERTLFFEKQKIDKKAAMRLKREKMKQARKRRELGLDADSDAPDAGAERERGGAGPMGNGRAELRDASPQALDAAKAMALIGRIGTEDDDQVLREQGEDEGGSELGDAGGRASDGNDDEQDAGDTDDDFGGIVETTFAPQMRIVDGMLVLDEDSLQIDRSKPTDTRPREVVEESAQDRFVNSRTFSKKPGKAKKWTLEETDRFYDALSQFGTDFELISALFPGRSRREIKLKWTKEDKINSKKITAALMQRKKIDLESYAKISGQDLSGPTPADPMDEIRERRAKLEADGHTTASGSHRRGQDGAPNADKRMKGKKKRGPIDEAGAALFDEDTIARQQEEAERERLEREQEEEERQARIEAMEAADEDDD